MLVKSACKSHAQDSICLWKGLVIFTESQDVHEPLTSKSLHSTGLAPSQASRHTQSKVCWHPKRSNRFVQSPHADITSLPGTPAFSTLRLGSPPPSPHPTSLFPQPPSPLHQTAPHSLPAPQPPVKPPHSIFSPFAPPLTLSTGPPVTNSGIYIGRWCQLVGKRNAESSIGTLCLQLFLAAKQAGNLHPLPTWCTPLDPPQDPPLATEGIRQAAVMSCILLESVSINLLAFVTWGKSSISSSSWKMCSC